MKIRNWWVWPRRHRWRATVLAVALIAAGLAWAVVGWLPSDGQVDQLLDRGDRLSSIVSAVLAAVGAGLAYAAWRRPVLPAEGAIGAATEVVRPAQLPADAHLFTGRKDELAELLRELVAARRRRLVAVAAIDGMAGVGKTALSVRLGHRLAGKFPDGQLFIDLHGHSDRIEPTEPADALNRLLVAVGVPPDRVPSDLDDRAALWRSILASRRLLVVLDNAANDAQVRPLLPGAPGSLILITSRQRLVGLATTYTLSLDTLPAPDAAALFIQSVGPDRMSTEPSELVAEAVDLCWRLPLAIRIAGARLRSRPTWHLSDLVERLGEQRQRLSELAAGSRSVAAALALSYRQLPAAQQQLYRLLGLHPGTDFDIRAVAALLDQPTDEAQLRLEQLVDAHLLEELRPGRYTFHDLVRAHATGTAAEGEPMSGQRRALARLLAYYRETAESAVAVLYPDEVRERIGPSEGAVPGPDGTWAAAEWLDIELPNVLAAARCAAATDPDPEYLVSLSSELRYHLSVRGFHSDAETIHELALAKARANGYRAGEVNALVGLGHLRRQQGLSKRAAADFVAARDAARATGDRAGEADALLGLADVERLRGRYEAATSYLNQVLAIDDLGGRRRRYIALLVLGHIHRLQGHYAQALADFGEAVDNPGAKGEAGETGALIGLGWVYLRQGLCQPAAARFEQALSGSRAARHQSAEANSLVGLGWVDLRLDRYGPAAERLGRALEIARSVGHRYVELDALVGLGHVHRKRGRHRHAAAYYEQALTIAHDINDRNWHIEALLGMGRLHQATGRPESARSHYQAALDLATELAQPVDRARAHHSLADLHRAQGQPAVARQHWQTALALLAGTGAENTEDDEVSVGKVRAHLDALGSETAGWGGVRTTPSERDPAT